MKISAIRAFTPLMAALGLTLLLLSFGPASSSTGWLLAQDEVPMRGDKKVLTIDDTRSGVRSGRLPSHLMAGG